MFEPLNPYCGLRGMQRNLESSLTAILAFLQLLLFNIGVVMTVSVKKCGRAVSYHEAGRKGLTPPRQDKFNSTRISGAEDFKMRMFEL